MKHFKHIRNVVASHAEPAKNLSRNLEGMFAFGRHLRIALRTITIIEQFEEAEFLKDS